MYPCICLPVGVWICSKPGGWSMPLTIEPRWWKGHCGWVYGILWIGFSEHGDCTHAGNYFHIALTSPQFPQKSIGRVFICLLGWMGSPNRMLGYKCHTWDMMVMCGILYI